MKKKIKVSAETTAKLMRVFGVGERCVKNALAYRRDNALARKVRMAAMENGGEIGTEVREAECWHDEAADTMWRSFDNGALLECDKRTGHITLRDRKGAVRGEWDNPHVSEMGAIAEVAASL